MSLKPRRALGRRLLRVGPGDALLPELLRAPVMFQDFPALGFVHESDALHALARPVEKESGRGLADAVPVRTDFDVKRLRGSEAEGLLVVGDGADQEPATLPELQAAQRARFRPVLVSDLALHPPVPDDLQKADRVLGRQSRLEVDPELPARRR